MIKSNHLSREISRETAAGSLQVVLSFKLEEKLEVLETFCLLHTESNCLRFLLSS